ncbi:methyltransferase domain-containing protein [Streptomyces sp. NPDC049597]|uniref:class I SAM-dependent methyltransferase n=1 Tax=Streptomyces sp. NPDC049597 TaxID=3155276 RepID=UPI003430733D
MNTVRELSAADWDQWWNRDRIPRLISDVELQKFLTRVRPKPGMTAVGIGCGDGRWTRQLARWGMNVTGYDHSRAAIRLACAGGMSPGLEYHRWDVDADTIPPSLVPGSVDVVTLRLSLAYIDWARFLTDAARWLSPETGVLYALSDVTRYGDDVQQDPFRRALTEEQLASLGHGWASCERYSIGPRTALVLRGPGG